MRSAKARLRDLTAHENIEGVTAPHTVTVTSGPSTSSEAVSSLALMEGFIETNSLNTYYIYVYTYLNDRVLLSCNTFL